MSERSYASRYANAGVEWITLGLIVACYLAWGAALFWLPSVSLTGAVIMTGVLVAFHASLTHEVLHGHPFRSKPLNEATMFLPLNLMIPYNRFRDTHLDHHRDAVLTDPYDDPESNFLDPVVWNKMCLVQSVLYRVNNTLLGRVLIGPAIGQACFTIGDLKAMGRGDGEVIKAWALHVPGAAIVIWIVLQSAMPLWAYLISAYIGLGLLKIRTFLEHRAHERSRARTVIIEDRGPLAWLFLYNSLHVVHHMHPGAPWYALPKLYRENKARYLACNEAYVYRSYGEIFRQYLFRAKDPVPHPLWPHG
ncbi:MAG: fatty acid desaturase [Rhodobacteraceae bacterium]|nr:fatty acid desaturase [Paracoccaceae bacterium]